MTPNEGSAHASFNVSQLVGPRRLKAELPTTERAVCLKSARVMKAAASALNAVARHAEDLGVELCANPAVVEEHLTELQTIDRLVQHLTQIAIVISADDPVSAIDDVLLSDLKEFFSAAT